MCGICGYVSTGQFVAPVLREMLITMEKYRLGYESAGMATAQDSKITFMKSVGSVNTVFSFDGNWSKILLGSVGIGHVRYPSKIAPTGKNMFAHPFLSCDGKIVLVHNGTIYNYKEILCELQGHEFSSFDKEISNLNDSEVIVHLLEEEISKTKGNVTEAVRKTCEHLSENPKNQFLFAFIHLKEPLKVYVVSGRDYEKKRKVVIAHRRGFGAIFASYRDYGINGYKPIKFEAFKPYIDFEKDKFDILDYDTTAILTKYGYRCLKLNA
jgi:glucosamine 6-phosphate synthetase-like amidotransferase/phosphosugar isomerase protein